MKRSDDNFISTLKKYAKTTYVKEDEETPADTFELPDLLKDKHKIFDMAETLRTTLDAMDDNSIIALYENCEEELGDGHGSPNDDTWLMLIDIIDNNVRPGLMSRKKIKGRK